MQFPAGHTRFVYINQGHIFIHQVSHIHDTVFLTAGVAERTGTPLVGSITTPIQSTSPVLHALMRAADRAVLWRFGVRHWRRVVCSDSTQARYAADAYGRALAGRLVRHIHQGVHERVRRGPAEEKTPWPQIVTAEPRARTNRSPTRLPGQPIRQSPAP